MGMEEFVAWFWPIIWYRWNVVYFQSFLALFIGMAEDFEQNAKMVTCCPDTKMFWSEKDYKKRFLLRWMPPIPATNLRRILRWWAWSKRTVRKGIHTMLFNVGTDGLKNISDFLNFLTQTWKRLAGVMIQMPFIDGTYSSVKWLRNKITKNPDILAWQKRSANLLRLSLMLLFKIKEFCRLYNRQKNTMIRLCIK